MADDGSGEIMLFGVRVKVDLMRKSVSMNNLSEYHQETKNKTPSAASYASDDDVARPRSAASRERKRGVPWTEEEHKLFLLGLQKVGKGDWRGISRNFVKTRTPTQVASHAQKYFLRKTNLNKRRHRSSLFDITTDSAMEQDTANPMEQDTANPMEQDNENQENMIQSPKTPNINGFPVAPNNGQVNNASSMLVGSLTDPLLESPTPSTAAAFSQNLANHDPTSPLDLLLSFDHHSQQSSRQSGYEVAPNLSKGDGMISVV